MCFVDIEKAFDRVPRISDGMGDEKEGFTRSNRKSGNEPPSRSKNES